MMNHRIFVLLICLVLTPELVKSQKVSIWLDSNLNNSEINYRDKHITHIYRKFDNNNFEMRNTIVFSKNVDFGNSYFENAVNLSSATYLKYGGFAGVKFGSEADMQFAVFNQNVYFSGSKFSGLASFNEAIFKNQVSFYGSKFLKPVNFAGTQFDNEAVFSNVKFDSVVNFNYARFHNKVDLKTATFSTQVSFKGANVLSTLNFDGSFFYGYSDFRFTKFHHRLDLNNLKTTENTRFDFFQAILPDTLSISNNPNLLTKSESELDFTACNFIKDEQIKTNGFFKRFFQSLCYYFKPSSQQFNNKANHLINLNNTNVSKVKLDYIHFKLYFELVIPESENNRADSIQIIDFSKDNKATVYEALLKNFKDRGQIESYQALDIEYQRFHEDLKPDDFSLQDWWWRYGYEKWRIFFHILLFTSIFSVYNFIRLDSLIDPNDGVVVISNLPNYANISRRNQRYYLNRAAASLAFTLIIFFPLPNKINEIKFRNFRGAMWVLFIFSIGILCIGYLVNFIIQ